MSKLRMAGKALKWLTGDSSKGELAYRLGMDAVMGGLVGLQQPGDLGDKLIAGLTDASFASVGGLAAGKLGGANQMARNFLDMGGSMAAAYAAMPVSEQILRVKGGGLSPYEKIQLEQDQLYRKQIEADLLRRLNATAPASDQFLRANGLG